MEETKGSQEEVGTVVYPIAELFASVQGEGYYVGTRFAFIRLAGCSVGRFDPQASKERGLPSYYEVCTSFDGKTFMCDTNFTMVKRYSSIEILAWVINTNVKHVCITGGEPMMHDIKHLVDVLLLCNVIVHIETSGTIHPTWLLGEEYLKVWIAVSPKQGYQHSMIERANEVKILVHDTFDPEELPMSLVAKNNVFLQPVNHIHSLDNSNIKRCLKLIEKNPTWRLSIQMHKVIGER